MAKKRENPLESLQKARAESEARRKLLLERMKTRHTIAKTSSTSQKSEDDQQYHLSQFNIEDAVAAAKRLRLMTLDGDLGAPTPLNHPTVEMLQEFLLTLSTRVSAAILQWPFGQNDISLLHPLAMLALIGTPAKQTTQGLTWCEPAYSFRTLFFPFRGGTTGANQSSLLVHRNEILSWNSYHLTRQKVNSSNSVGLIDRLHETLGHLNELRQRDTSKPHLAHPTLSEIYPTFSADRNCSAQQYFEAAIEELFMRVRYGAALNKQTDHRASLSDPFSAAYGFFAVSPHAAFRQALSVPALSPPQGLPPDICLLELDHSALSRLGANWKELVDKFITETNLSFPNLPFLAITQDTFVHRHLINIIHKTLRSNNHPRSRVLIRLSHDPLSNDTPPEQVTDTTVNFTTVAGPSSDALTALADAARGSSDPMLASNLRRGMGTLRKAASLPCGLASAYEYLCKEIGQSATEIFLEYRSSGTLLAPLERSLDSEIGGTERKRLVKARDAVAAAFKHLDSETPIGSLLTDMRTTILRKSGSTVIVFSTDIDLKLGVNRLTEDDDLGNVIHKHIITGSVILTSAEDLDSKLAEIEAEGRLKSLKTLVLIAPSLDWLSRVVSREWLPDDLIILCERRVAARASSIYRYLSLHADLAGEGYLGSRLASIAEAAKNELDARNVSSVELDYEPQSEYQATDGIIDLTDEDSDDNVDIKLFTLLSGRKLQTRSGARLIRYDRNAAINPFETTRARDVCIHDTLVVPDEKFIAEARDVIPLRVLAQSWVDVYHAMVKAHIANIPGNTMSAKAREILNDIQSHGAQPQNFATVLGWLKVDEYMQEPPERRRPHAPQHWREFKAFMEVLGIDSSVTDKIWTEGIQPLRVDRRRAGQKSAQAFISVLVDPHGTASGFSASVRDGIKALRRKALDHLDQVVDVATINLDEQ